MRNVFAAIFYTLIFIFFLLQYGQSFYGVFILLNSKSYIISIFYLSCVAFMTISSILMLSLKSNILRILFCALMCILFSFDWVLFQIYGQFINSNLLSIIYLQIGMIGDVVSYGRIAFWGCIIALLMFAPLLALRFSSPFRDRTILLLFVLSSGLSIAINFRTNGGTSEFPAPQAFVGHLAVTVASYVTEPKTVYPGPLPEPDQNHQTQNIIFVVDESVRGDHASEAMQALNAELLREHQHKIIDYGSIASGSNCSHAARLLLRSGLQPGDDLRKIVPGSYAPGLFRYAAHAGYNVVVIDAWNMPGEYRNLGEWKYIHQYVDMKDISMDKRDENIAQLIEKNIRKDMRNFVYVSKIGVHFPYKMIEHAIKDSKRSSADRAFSRYLENIKYYPLNNEKFNWIDIYRNSVFSNIKIFFSNFLEQKIDNYMLIYTSDHGQSLWEDGANATHCTENPRRGEIDVPLVLMSSDEVSFRKLREAASSRHAHVSHTNLFPYFLSAMGYPRGYTGRHYGVSFLDAVQLKTPRIAISGRRENGLYSFAAQWREFSITRNTTAP